MMDAHDLAARPTLQFVRERLAWRHCAVRPSDRTFRHAALDPRVEPKFVIAPQLEVAIKIGGGIQRIPRKKNLRHWTLAQSEVSRGNQDIGVCLPYESRQRALLLPEALPRASSQIRCHKHHPLEFGEFLPDGGTDRNRGSRIVSRGKLWNDVAKVRKPAAGAGSEPV